MNYVVATCLVLLGLWFYLASGGSEFEPIAVAPEPAPEAPDESISVERVTLDAPVAAPEPEPVPAETAAAEPAPTTTLTPPPALAGDGAPADDPIEGAIDDAVAAALQAVEDNAPARAEPSRELRYVAGSRVNMREGPDTSFPVVTVVVEGTPMEVLSEADGWMELRDPEGRTGWMAASLLR